MKQLYKELDKLNDDLDHLTSTFLVEINLIRDRVAKLRQTVEYTEIAAQELKLVEAIEAAAVTFKASVPV